MPRKTGRMFSLPLVWSSSRWMRGEIGTAVPALGVADGQIEAGHPMDNMIDGIIGLGAQTIPTVWIGIPTGLRGDPRLRAIMDKGNILRKTKESIMQNIMVKLVRCMEFIKETMDDKRTYMVWT